MHKLIFLSEKLHFAVSKRRSVPYLTHF